MNLGLKGALLLAPLLASGCSVLGSSWDGTWLIEFDPNVAVEGSCAEDVPEDSETFIIGTDVQLVDIYKAESGYVVLMDNRFLYGAVVDGTLHATFAEAEDGPDYASATDADFRGTLDGGVMTGTLVTAESEEIGDGDPYDCTTTVKYTAERIVSDPDTYDIGQEE